MKAYSIVILAAGKGTRMYSCLPKVLHPLAGKPLLQHLLDTVNQLKAQAIHVVCGYGKEQLQQQISQPSVNWIEQAEQLGTGHAVAQALPYLHDDEYILVLVGDTPLITQATLERLIVSTPDQGVGLLTVELTDSSGFGRIVRNDAGDIVSIVEEKDASDEQCQIREVNTGIMCLPVQRLRTWVPQLQANNQQGELYLTDVIAMAVAESCPVVSSSVHSVEEVASINHRQQLARVERYYQQQQAERLMLQGVTLVDPKRLDIRGEVQMGQDVLIDVNVILEGKVVIGNHVKIGANVILKDVNIADEVEIHPFSHIEGASIAEQAKVGPYARLRPGTKLAKQVKVGNFVEVKKSTIGIGSKVNHLSYIGDARIGRQVNIGAGTITCNYDGVNKLETVIEEGAFIGSNTALVAPITVGQYATIGAGSAVSHSVPANKLTVARAKTRTLDHWQRSDKVEKP